MKKALENQTSVTLTAFAPKNEISRLACVWKQLSHASDPSFFLSWPWIENWLNCLPESTKVMFVGLFEDDMPIAGFFVGTQTGIKHQVIYAQRGFLNATGDAVLDEITIEQNGILFNGDTSQIIHKLRELISDGSFSWDELVCNALTLDQYHCFKQLEGESKLLEMEQEKNYFVDLEKVRHSSSGLIGLLGKSKRNRIRRTAKAYEKFGELSITEAATHDEFTEAFSNLERLHQQAWSQRGQAGSFSNPFFKNFHQRFIENYYASGQIKLITCKAGNEILGVLYCFAHNDDILFYQCGFNYKKENHYRPGLLSQLHVINYFAQQGYAKFDFLAGESRYKRKLATDHYPVYWCKLQRPKLRFSCERLLRRLKNKIRNVP